MHLASDATLFYSGTLRTPWFKCLTIPRRGLTIPNRTVLNVGTNKWPKSPGPGAQVLRTLSTSHSSENGWSNLASIISNLAHSYFVKFLVLKKQTHPSSITYWLACFIYTPCRLIDVFFLAIQKFNEVGNGRVLIWKSSSHWECEIESVDCWIGPSVLKFLNRPELSHFSSTNHKSEMSGLDRCRRCSFPYLYTRILSPLESGQPACQDYAGPMLPYDVTEWLVWRHL